MPERVDPVHLRRFLTETPDLMAIVSADGIRKFVNPAWTAVLGWTQAELEAQRFTDLIHPGDVASTFRAWATQYEGAPTIAFIARYRHRDGHYIPIEWTAWPVGDDVFGIGRDISNRVALERALVESRAVGDSVLGMARSAIITVSEDGIIEGFNPAAEATFGYRATEVLGKAVTILTPEPWTELHAASLERHGADAAPDSGGGVREIDGIRRDGTRFPVELSVSQVDHGERRTYIGVAVDLSERREAALALDAARREAERANAAKTEFLSRMSHELRTPLNAMLGFAQLLEADAVTPAQHEATAMIITAGEHLLGLINEVLDITSIEAGKLSLSLEAVSLADVVHDGLAMIAPQAGARAVEISGPRRIDPYVLADRQRLKQVLLNLLSNAVKYVHVGGHVVLDVIGAAPAADGTPRVRVSVRDDGPGIAPESMPRLFVPFERPGAEDLAIEGTGLGLAVASRLVEAMGGRIGVDSELGAGATFWFELAVADPPRVRTAERRVVEEPVPEVPATRGTVLYIEDNESNLRLVAEIVHRWPGLGLLAAADGAAGLAMAVTHRPDLILLDLNLPDLPGGSVLDQLRHDDRTRDIPLVVVSADANPARIEALTAAGAAAYVTKPIDVRGFVALLSRYFPPVAEAPVH